jgi:hypothetical protein
MAMFQQVYREVESGFILETRPLTPTVIHRAGGTSRQVTQMRVNTHHDHESSAWAYVEVEAPARMPHKFFLIFQHLEETAARPGGLGLPQDCFARANNAATVHPPSRASTDLAPLSLNELTAISRRSVSCPVQ